MKAKALDDLSRLVKKAGEYKPDQIPHKPEKQPNVKELKTVYTLNLKTFKISVDS